MRSAKFTLPHGFQIPLEGGDHSSSGYIYPWLKYLKQEHQGSANVIQFKGTILNSPGDQIRAQAYAMLHYIFRAVVFIEPGRGGLFSL